MGLSRSRRPVPREEFEANVEDLSSDGRGVARVDGKVVFIAAALPGERVRFRYLARGRDADEATLSAVICASEQRVEPPCPHFAVCGGCVLQHLAPAAQIAFKHKQLIDSLARIGKLVAETVAEPILGPVAAYRRRARLGVKVL